MPFSLAAFRGSRGGLPFDSRGVFYTDVQQKARLVAENLWFNVFFAVVIMSNSVFLGMQLEWSALRVDRPGGEEGSVLAMGGIEATWEETALILKIDVHRKKNWAWAIARGGGAPRVRLCLCRVDDPTCSDKCNVLVAFRGRWCPELPAPQNSPEGRSLFKA